jgi:hypothetical protein
MDQNLPAERNRHGILGEILAGKLVGEVLGQGLRDDKSNRDCENFASKNSLLSLLIACEASRMFAND